MNDGYAPTGDDFLYYRDAGDGDLVVLIHAGVADSRMWLPQLEKVPDGYHFVAFDQRGFGKSKMGSGEYANHLDVLAILNYFSADRATLVGCSMGAGTALQVAITTAERVKGLVLVGGDSPGYQPPGTPYEPPQWPEAVNAFAAGDLERVAELESEMWIAGHGRTLDVVDPAVVSLLIEMDLIALRSEQARDEVRHPGPDSVAGMSTIEAPTLVIVGQYDHPNLVASADDLAQKLSSQPAVVIPNAAHLVGLEQPEAFNSALFRFLASL